MTDIDDERLDIVDQFGDKLLFIVLIEDIPVLHENNQFKYILEKSDLIVDGYI